MKGGKLLKVHGRASVLAGCVIANRLAHLYGAIAVFDPKIGEPGLDKYVIVISHNSDQVGDILEISTEVKSNLKIVLCGSPNTGKTVMREGLKTALLQRREAPSSYVISGCPDGDGSWYSETAQKYPELAKELKAKYKDSFTPEFAESKAQAIESIQNPLLVFDVGGEKSPENEIIMSKATHAVILAKTEAEVKEWQEFCQKLNLPVLAILYSDLKAKADQIQSQYPPLLEGIIHHLERGEDVSNRPTIHALVDVLIQLSSAN
ncbi:CRISPR-associated protein Csx3 [Merismopedia glauca CCAP 1448/3]|uniref:CRISPR-associated protein Csx3 n=1 Tax=Merismopedia glauca CCAP 1448/3 TaxID=1296344 RepID=A0A2T1C1N5_9CYAN|nr:CRISPR-associated protein Csx3 [Merismopedia glauca CCAP 1448/3]